MTEETRKEVEKRLIERRKFLQRTGKYSLIAASSLTVSAFASENKVDLSDVIYILQSVAGIRPVLSSIKIEPAEVASTLPVGNTKQLSAKGIYSDGSNRDVTAKAVWISSDMSVATVNNSGLVSADTEGTTTVTASLGAISGSMDITVTPAALNSILLTPENPSIPEGTTKQFSAIGQYTDGTSHDITAQVDWSSSNTSVATVDASGLASAVAVGTTTITATSGNISNNTTLTVTLVTLTYISVYPENPSVIVGNTKQFLATGEYSDDSAHDITAQVDWSSSNTSVATISSGGLASTVAVGTTTITARSGDISGSATLTVISDPYSDYSDWSNRWAHAYNDWYNAWGNWINSW